MEKSEREKQTLISITTEDIKEAITKHIQSNFKELSKSEFEINLPIMNMTVTVK